MKLRSHLLASLPATARYRAVALAFRLRAEQRLVLLDHFVPRGGLSVDAGVWWGPWTYWLSRRSDVVWAFEPNPRMAGDLRAVAPSNVRVEAVALSSTAGTGSLFAPDAPGPDALGTLSVVHRSPGSRRIAVQLETLDRYELEDVRFVKIDVENHERDMLAGAVNTFERWHPAVLIEIEQRFHDEPIAEIFRYFEDLGYAGWIRRKGRWDRLETFDVVRDQLQHLGRVHSPEYVNNFVFLADGGEPGPTRHAGHHPH